ncbi:GFA family protein [Acuticoccus sp. M5D2P5]|nr:GFA family protein [Acuticoccus kalidii]MCF3933825.1 GFA family protein [Acuticoccus kalidii]
MEHAQSPLVGTCRCGRTAIEVRLPPIMVSACHCRGCQRMSASAYSLTAMIPSEGFAVMTGEPVRGGARSPEISHYFCDDCKSWMYTELGMMPGIVNVRPTMFDNDAWTRPFIETMTAEKLAWATTPARYSYPGFPPLEDYERLLGEFADAWRG